MCRPTRASVEISSAVGGADCRGANSNMHAAELGQISCNVTTYRVKVIQTVTMRRGAACGPTARVNSSLLQLRNAAFQQRIGTGSSTLLSKLVCVLHIHLRSRRQTLSVRRHMDSVIPTSGHVCTVAPNWIMSSAHPISSDHNYTVQRTVRSSLLTVGRARSMTFSKSRKEMSGGCT